MNEKKKKNGKQEEGAEMKQCAKNALGYFFCNSNPFYKMHSNQNYSWTYEICEVTKLT